MPIKPILLMGHPILYQVAKPLLPPQTTTAQKMQMSLITDLRDTLLEFQRQHGFGRAIAAPQIGQAVRAIYIITPQRHWALINPTFTPIGPETIDLWDDCFSLPDLFVKVRRYRQIHLTYTDEMGTIQERDLADDLAELIQHEYDHLDGILMVARAIDRHSFSFRSELHHYIQSSR